MWMQANGKWPKKWVLNFATYFGKGSGSDQSYISCAERHGHLLKGPVAQDKHLKYRPIYEHRSWSRANIHATCEKLYTCLIWRNNLGETVKTKWQSFRLVILYYWLPRNCYDRHFHIMAEVAWGLKVKPIMTKHYEN